MAKVLRKEGAQISIFAIIYGIWLIVHPNIINNFNTYEVVRLIGDSGVVGGLFILGGTIKIIGHFLDKRWLKRFGIILQIVFWSVYCASLAMVDTNNSVILFSGLMTLICLRIARYTA